jgi:long-chain fatty acid transport protein
MRLHALSSKCVLFLAVALSIALSARTASAQYGTLLTGTGAVNRSFGGVAVAAPLSPAGALFWNPATLSGLERSEVEAGAELLFPHSQLSSQISAGALGHGIPAAGMAGSTDSDTGVFPLPTIGLAYLPEDSKFSFGLGVFALAGFGVDYAASSTNPVLTARPPNGIGFGPVYSQFEVLQLSPSVAYRLTDRLSVAAGPALDLAILSVDPAVFAPPDNASGNGFASYPTGTHSQTTWGGGFIAGVYYKADTWGLGASVKSPQWLDTFRYNSADQVGHPRTLTFSLDLPMIVSVGAAYSGWDRWLLAVDLRYLDYHNVDGLGDRGFTADSALRGVGWRSIFAVAAGAQYQLTDALSLRLGYTWNQTTVPDSQSFVNALSPVIIEHTVYAGASWKVTDDFTLSVAYLHGFQNSIAGPLLTAAGPVPGTSVGNSTSGDGILFSGSVKFGGPRKCHALNDDRQ